ncbi:hypothetical protein [Endozoicomonas sp.]|uniref:hypothetical protein n=1 Tax=Endozoicomonas sp. TaxID=1892382 RepID=UPI00383AAF3B
MNNNDDHIDRFMSRENIYSVSIVDDAEPGFSYQGCECCNDSLGNNVTDCTGISNDKDNSHEYALCNECIYSILYGE